MSAIHDFFETGSLLTETCHDNFSYLCLICKNRGWEKDGQEKYTCTWKSSFVKFCKIFNFFNVLRVSKLNCQIRHKMSFLYEFIDAPLPPEKFPFIKKFIPYMLHFFLFL